MNVVKVPVGCAMSITTDHVAIMERSRARCIREDLAYRLRQAENGKFCLLENAETILQLAKELVEVEDRIDTLLMTTL
jgi:hypothetical protein